MVQAELGDLFKLNLHAELIQKGLAFHLNEKAKYIGTWSEIKRAFSKEEKD
jgi:hypothetical protein